SRNQGEEGGAGVGGPVHVADVDFIERRFSDTQYERSLFFEADIGSPLDQMSGDAVGNAGQRAHAAGYDHHSIGGIGAAGDIGSDVGVGLDMNFACGFARTAAKDLSHEIAAAAKTEFFRDDSQRAVGGDEVHRLHTVIAVNREQEVFKE